MSNVKNIIFLDIDGVLNTTRTAISNRAHKHRENGAINKELDPIGAGILMEVLNKFNAKIVITSVWRLGSVLTDGNEIENMLYVNLVDIGLVSYLYKPETNLWRTELLNGRKRGVEVKKWLSLNGKDIKNYVIIDDDIDFLNNQRKHFVNTDANVGLTYGSYLRMVDIFKNKSKRHVDFPDFEV